MFGILLGLNSSFIMLSQDCGLCIITVSMSVAAWFCPGRETGRWLLLGPKSGGQVSHRHPLPPAPWVQGGSPLNRFGRNSRVNPVWGFSTLFQAPCKALTTRSYLQLWNFPTGRQKGQLCVCSGQPGAGPYPSLWNSHLLNPMF